MSTRSVVTIGNFDGVHLGHQALIARACEGDAPSVGVFFDPHPTAFFAPERAPKLLTSPSRRAELLRAYGLDSVDVRAFDDAFAAQTPDEFVANVLVKSHAAKRVVVGHDFRFGRDRAGNTDTLRELGQTHDFDVVEVAPVSHEGSVVSSTSVREHVQSGDVVAASALLGRFHETEGTVVQGDQRGRTIGFPTANLEIPGIVPADGVYAVVCRVLDTSAAPIYGVANVGVRPTFEAGRSVEVFLFDFDRDIYGETLRVGWVQRLRGEVRFDGIDALVAQLNQDVENAKSIHQVGDARARWI